jgi:hypothetical protein
VLPATTRSRQKKALEKLKGCASTLNASLVKEHQLRLLQVLRESTPHDGTDKRRDSTKVHPATVNKRLRGKACASSSQHALQPPAKTYYTRPRRRRWKQLVGTSWLSVGAMKNGRRCRLNAATGCEGPGAGVLYAAL